MSSQKLAIDQDVCIQCGNCVAAYPDLFEFTDDGKVKVKEGADFSKHNLAEVKNICPSSAIKDVEVKAQEKSEEK
jgi:ferredoxin